MEVDKRRYSEDCLLKMMVKVSGVSELGKIKPVVH